MKDRFLDRKYMVIGLIVLVGMLYIFRLFYIQVIDSQYLLSAENNSRRYVVKYPARGLIYDRKGRLMVYNEASYDLMIIPGQVEKFDTVRLEQILDVSHKQFMRYFHKAKDYNIYRPSVLIKQISAEQYAVLQEILYRYPGFYVQARTFRKYPYKTAAHMLGYVGEVDKRIVEKKPYYQSGDYIGISGLESAYEKQLRGQKGGEFFNVDVRGRIKGKLRNGEYDTVAVVGKNLYTSIDIELQNYGEKLMANKKGSIVAIDPSTGEIICMVSAPTYDPNLLVGRQRTAKYWELFNDPIKPLFNRAIMAAYPPGSTFKPVNALISLQEKIINFNTTYPCHNGYFSGPIAVQCHPHYSPITLTDAITVSCNSYFCNSFRNFLDDNKFGSVHQGYAVFRNYVDFFGFGRKLGIEFSNEVAGKFPRPEYYDKLYGGPRGWRSLTVFSLAIGQGEICLTPLQNCNSACIIANGGYYIIPHVVKAIEGQKAIDPKYRVKHFIPVDKEYVDFIKEAMNRVTTRGTGGTASWCEIPDIPSCGKTGTAQNPHGANHSIFIGFAPKDNPKIAIAVYVENAGYGASWAAPIASLMMEKYLKDSISRPWVEKYILNKDFLHGTVQGTADN